MNARATAVIEICEVEGGKGTVNKSTVIEWFRQFDNSETSLEHQPRSGRPSTMIIEALHLELVEQQPQTGTCRLLDEPNSSKSTTSPRHLNKIGPVNRHCRDKFLTN